MDIKSRIRELKEAMSSKSGPKEIGDALREDYESRPHRPLNESISPKDTKFYVGKDGMTYYTDGMNYLIIGDESANSLPLREKFMLVKKQVDDLAEGGRICLPKENAYWTRVLRESGDIELIGDDDPIGKALADYFSVDEDEVTKVRDHEYEVEGSTYWVGSPSEAEEHAHEECMDLIDDMGLESFSKDYQEYILNDSKFFDYDTVRGWMHESYEGYVQDIEDESDDEFGNRLIQEMHDVGILKDDDFEEVDGIVDHSQLRDSIDMDEKKEQYVDYLCEDVDPVDWLRGIYSEEELAKLVDEQGLIDWDKVADDCVNTDGTAHYIASYDGNEIQITDSLSAFRLD